MGWFATHAVYDLTGLVPRPTISVVVGTLYYRWPDDVLTKRQSGRLLSGD